MTDMRWGGDPLPPGLTYEDRIGWEVAATVIVRLVPDPETGKGRGLTLEYSSSIPKVVLAHQLMNVVQDLMTHDDFQDGVPLQHSAECECGDEEEGTDG